MGVMTGKHEREVEEVCWWKGGSEVEGEKKKKGGRERRGNRDSRVQIISRQVNKNGSQNKIQIQFVYSEIQWPHKINQMVHTH